MFALRFAARKERSLLAAPGAALTTQLVRAVSHFKRPPGTPATARTLPRASLSSSSSPVLSLSLSLSLAASCLWSVLLQCVAKEEEPAQSKQASSRGVHALETAAARELKIRFSSVGLVSPSRAFFGGPAKVFFFTAVRGISASQHINPERSARLEREREREWFRWAS